MLGDNVKEYINNLTTTGICYKLGVEPEKELLENIEELFVQSEIELNELLEKAKACDYWHDQYTKLVEETKKADSFSYQE